MSDGRVEGKVHVVEETKTFGRNNFRKRVVVLEQDSGRFTNYIPVEFIQDGCDTVDNMVLGDDVEITFTLTGRKWQKDAASEVRYFLAAQASAWKSLTGNSHPDPSSSQERSAPAAAPQDFDEDNVPF